MRLDPNADHEMHPQKLPLAVLRELKQDLGQLEQSEVAVVQASPFDLKTGYQRINNSC